MLRFNIRLCESHNYTHTVDITLYPHFITLYFLCLILRKRIKSLSLSLPKPPPPAPLYEVFGSPNGGRRGGGNLGPHSPQELLARLCICPVVVIKCIVSILFVQTSLPTLTPPPLSCFESVAECVRDQRINSPYIGWRESVHV